MCGLVGAMVNGNQWTLSKGELETFTNLLYCSALRGAHSTGIMWFDGTNNHILKMAMHPADFIFTKEYQNVMVPGKIKAIFGHTRYATSGKINAKNAHPFKARNRIILMHNGNVSKVVDNTATDFEVDSMALADALSKEDPNKVFESFDGAVACIWFDNKSNSVNFYRNHQRPFHYTTGFATKFMASEAHMLDWVCGRGFNGHTHVGIKELPAMHMHQIKLDDIGKVLEEKIERKYNHSNYAGSSRWPHHYGYDPDLPDEYDIDVPFKGYKGRDPISGYQPVIRNVPAVIQHPPGHLRVVGKEALPEKKASLKRDHLLRVSKDGPFANNRVMLFVAYESEQYSFENSQGHSVPRYKVKLTPVLGGEDKKYDIPKYNSVNCECYGLTKEEADEVIKNGFVSGQVINIVFNTDYVNDDDRLTVYLTKVTPISKEGAIINGN